MKRCLKDFLLKTGLLTVLLFTSCSKEDNASNEEIIDPPQEEEVTEPTPTLEMVVDNLENPWGMAFLPDGGLLISELNGTLLLYKDGSLTEITGVPEVSYSPQSQGGLLDIALHPDHENNGWIYFTYASPEGNETGANTALMRAQLTNNVLTNHELLYKAGPNTESPVHFGSRITFDREGFVYFSIGDRGERDLNPQDLSRDGGKIYRLHDDGTIPADNPFVNEADAIAATYTYGHRNPQGMTLHPDTGEIWTHEHGPLGGDEINILTKGANYGWPVITYGLDYDGSPISDKTHEEGMEQPLHYWDPSIAPCGMTFLTSSAYPDWQGSLFIGSLKFQYLVRMEINGGNIITEEKLFENTGRIRNVQQGPDGLLYVAVQGKGIYKVVMKS